MEAPTEIVVRRVEKAKALWDELKARWGELKLPGSAYMPQDFITLLMLADVEGDATTVADKVRSAADRLSELKRDSRTSFHLLGSDALAILALISADGIIAAEPEPEPIAPPVVVPPPAPVELPAPVVACPHCAHGFDACAAGEYRPTPTPPAPTPVVAPSRTSDAPASFDPCAHVDTRGRCTECTKDEVIECSDCGNNIIESHGHACKNCGTGRNDCGSIYCDDCKSNLSDYGYCPDCATIQCSGCDDDVEAGTEKRCANEQCHEDDAYCDRCAGDLLNRQGLCMTCSKEDRVECDSCGESFTESRVTFCTNRGCDTCFCAAHAGRLDPQGVCKSCR